MIIRDLARRQSNWRSEEHLDDYLRRHGLAGIAGIDTRRLTRHIRDTGAMPGRSVPPTTPPCCCRARPSPARPVSDLVSLVTTPSRTRSAAASEDRGLRLRREGHDAAPSRRDRHRHRRAGAHPAEEVLAMNPDGVFLSNGPGDPEEAGPIVDELPKLLGKVRSSVSASAIKCCRSRSGAGPTR